MKTVSDSSLPVFNAQPNYCYLKATGSVVQTRKEATGRANITTKTKKTPEGNKIKESKTYSKPGQLLKFQVQERPLIL